MTGKRRVGSSLLTAAVLLAVSVSGCGSDSKREDTSNIKAVAKVMADLDTASRSGDGKWICGQLFTRKLAHSVTTSSSGRTCAAEVRAKLFSPDTKISVENIDVPDAANASASVKEANGNTSTILLVKQAGRWRIRGVAPA